MINVHQSEVPNTSNGDEHLSNEPNVSRENCDNHTLQFEGNDFKSALSEFQSVSQKLREKFLENPTFFKNFIQSYVTILKNSLTSDFSLNLACGLLNDCINRSDSFKD